MTSLINSKKTEIKNLLKKYYNFENFRLGQEQAIDNILEKKDTVVVMPTSGGKSLIFQLKYMVPENYLKVNNLNLKLNEIRKNYVNSSRKRSSSNNRSCSS